MKNFRSFLKYDQLALIFIIIIVLGTQYNYLDNRPYWDDITIVLGAHEFAQSRFHVGVVSRYFMHPPFLVSLFSLMELTGFDYLLLDHLIIALFSVIGLYYMYLLSKMLVNDRVVAVLSSLLLYVVPTYFSFTGRLYTPIPVVALSLACFYYLFKGKMKMFAILGVIGVLTKETFLIILVPAAFWLIISDKKKELRYLIWPILALTAWELLFARTWTSTFMLKWEMNESLNLTGASIMYWLHIIYSAVFKTGVWVLFIPVIVDIAKNRKHYLDKINMTLFVWIGANLAFYLFTVKLERYFLPILPMIILLAVRSLSKIEKKAMFVSVLVISLFFIIHFQGSRQDVCGCQLDTNMEYLESLNTYVAAADYVNSHYSNVTILTVWPMTKIFSENTLGFSRRYNVSSFLPGGNYSKVSGLLIRSSQQEVTLSPDFNRYLEQRRFSLKLVKRFQEGTKYTDVYETVQG